MHAAARRRPSPSRETTAVVGRGAFIVWTKNMASVCTCLFVAVLCFNVGNASSFVNVECKADISGQYGQQSMLDCVVKLREEAIDAKITMVIWKKDGVAVASYENGIITNQPHFQFAKLSGSNNHMNVSLLITNTKISDSGRYQCTVLTDSGDNNNFTSLSVTAKYNTPTVHSDPAGNIPPNTDVMLFCESNGGFPQGDLRWFDMDKQEWTRSAYELEVKQTEDGLYKLSRKLHLLSGSVFDKYTCSVYNATASGIPEGEFTFTIPKAPVTGEFGSGGPDKQISQIVAPVLVIGSLIVGLLLLVLFRRRRFPCGDQQSHLHHQDAENGHSAEKEPCVNNEGGRPAEKEPIVFEETA